jgi:hypothetical protein
VSAVSLVTARLTSPTSSTTKRPGTNRTLRKIANAVATVPGQVSRARGATAPLSPIPRLGLRVAEAAAALGVSDDWYATNVAPEVRTVRRGRVKLVAVAELGRWLDENSERLLEEVSR